MWEVRYQVLSSSLWANCQLKGNCRFPQPQSVSIFFICLCLRHSGEVVSGKGATVFLDPRVRTSSSWSASSFVTLGYSSAEGGQQLCSTQEYISLCLCISPSSSTSVFVCLCCPLALSSFVSVVVPWWCMYVISVCSILHSTNKGLCCVGCFPITNL